MRIQTNTFFWGVPEWLKIAYSGTFLDVNHFPEIFKSSNLFLRHPDTSADAVEGLREARRYKSRNKSLPGRPGNHDFAPENPFRYVSGRKSLSRDS
jgi:hypothetical protein